MLPPEILISILSLDAIDECVTTCFAQINSLCHPKTPAWASVCSRWRQLYLRWHTTSSHLDLVVGGGTSNGYYRRAEIIAYRSPDAPLHLVIRDRVDRTIDYAVSSEEIATLISFISPLAPRVCALDIAFKNKSQLLLDSVITCWLNGRRRNPPMVLKVWNSIKSEPLQLNPPTDVCLGERGLPTYYWDFFRAIQTLALQHCYTPSDSCIFQGLINLHLDWPYKNPAPFDILQILAASPGLRWLSIDDVECVQREGSLDPVWLNSLRNLSLSQYMIKNSLNRFLPWLNTTSSAINMILRIINDPDFIPESRDFFHCSSVKRLFTYGVDRIAVL
ncbi:hypothetical protein FRC08_016476 [Ceratobasidium sp. 394]|nr:hypothetical protein FRC08_016476 [Ceratobasidium sp. 394]